MIYTVSCVVPGCTTTMNAETEEALIRLATDHVAESHSDKESISIVARIKQAIRRR